MTPEPDHGEERVDGRNLRADAERNRERVIEAARDLFAEQGLDASANEIARRAGVSRATFFNYFAAKSDLLWLEVDESLAAFPAMLAEADDDVEPMAAVREAVVRLAEGFGPDRLPKLITDVANVVRQLRRMASNATGDLSRELGTDISIEDLNPKTFVRKHLLSDDDQDLLTKPFRELASDVQETGRSLESSFDVNNALAADAPAPTRTASKPRFDVDAT